MRKSYEELYTVAHAARERGVERSYMYKLIKRGVVPSVDIDGVRFVPMGAVEGLPEGPRWVYICSHYGGDRARLIRAREYAQEAWAAGVVPIVPHLWFGELADSDEGEERERGCRVGLELIGLCDEVWVYLDGESESGGMRAEIAEARKRGVDVEIKG